MVVIVTQNVSESLRGELTRYMLELKAGVFIGTLNARVTELLWDRIIEKTEAGNAILARSDDSEQGFSLRMYGSPVRCLEEIDGITLIKYLKKEDP